MKKLFAILAALLCLQTAYSEDIMGGGSAEMMPESDGGWWYPLQLSLWPTTQLVPYDQNMAGIRLNIFGVNRNTAALDIGFVNQSDEAFYGLGFGGVNLIPGNSCGINMAIVNHVEGDAVGLQMFPLLGFSAANIVMGQMTGIQGGWYNQANTLAGVQLGILNYMQNGSGVQFGVANITDENCSGLQLGLVNIADEQLTGCQIGLYNGARHASGFQLALINHNETLSGLQIGLLNIASDKEVLPYMVLANWKF